MFEDVDN